MSTRPSSEKDISDSEDYHIHLAFVEAQPRRRSSAAVIAATAATQPTLFPNTPASSSSSTSEKKSFSLKRPMLPTINSTSLLLPTLDYQDEKYPPSHHEHHHHFPHQSTPSNKRGWKSRFRLLHRNGKRHPFPGAISRQSFFLIFLWLLSGAVVFCIIIAASSGSSASIFAEGDLGTNAGEDVGRCMALQQEKKSGGLWGTERFKELVYANSHNDEMQSDPFVRSLISSNDTSLLICATSRVFLCFLVLVTMFIEPRLLPRIRLHRSRCVVLPPIHHLIQLDTSSWAQGEKYAFRSDIAEYLSGSYISHIRGREWECNTVGIGDERERLEWDLYG